jgi:hypothetical protein
MTRGDVASQDRSKRVASVLARAATLSDELKGTIQELEQILRRPDEELEPPRALREGE